MNVAIGGDSLVNIFMTCALALPALPLLFLFQAALARIAWSVTLGGWMKFAILETATLYLAAISYPLPVFAAKSAQATLFGSGVNATLLFLMGLGIFFLIGTAAAYTTWHLFGHTNKKQ